MNVELMEELLNEYESSTLDFKRDQYPFGKAATEEQKSELLKDILAFANAWRRTDAYILIGVDEVKGGRSKVLGVTSHLDDANVQQFVNEKTNRPVSFSYQVFHFEGVQVGVIEVPLQDRPVYLNKDFGKLKRNQVYIRRGSSTAIAHPDEVATMGGVKLQVVANQSSSLPVNPVREALQREYEQQNVVLVENVIHAFNRFRWRSHVFEVTDLYATFRHVETGEEVSGSFSQMTVSFEPSMKMKLFIIAPVV
jgi:predicted HTH transcriptional regulator